MVDSSSQQRRTLNQPRWAWTICAALVALAGAVYWPVHSFGFVSFDDPGNVTENPHVISGLTAENLRWAFSSFWVGHWAPLTWISFQIDASVWHLNPAMMHVENMLLHALSTLLVFALLKITTGRLWPSAWVAAVFAVHPLHVESVAWITERRDVLSSPLLLAAMIAYACHANADRHRRWWFIGALLLYVLSLTAKALGITLPIVLLLLDLWPLQRRARLRQLLLEKIPFLVPAMAAAWAAQRAQSAVGAALSLADQPVGARLCNAIVSYALYVEKFVLPWRLAVFYPLRTWSVGQVVAAGSVLILITAGTVISRRRYAMAAWFWFLVMLLPMIGLFQSGSQGMADRYMYLPVIGLSILPAWAFAELRWRRSAAILGVGSILCLAGIARNQLEYWRSSHELLSHALTVINDGAELHIQLAQLDLREGSKAQAKLEYEAALRIDPQSAPAEFDLGNLLLDQPALAIGHLKRAVNLRPDWARAKNNLAIAWIKAGRKDLAFSLLQEAIAQDAGDADAHANLGMLLMEAGQNAAALREFDFALRIDSANPTAQAGLRSMRQ
jgi:hypothetical protein